jgi:hypothetical protein
MTDSERELLLRLGNLMLVQFTEQRKAFETGIYDSYYDKGGTFVQKIIADSIEQIDTFTRLLNAVEHGI